ncbi:Hypothetical protein A7982_08714 [Minicystis rosea]|nr:Hypothetical protein A7982_08714 [Minicystis rosea]
MRSRRVIKGAARRKDRRSLLSRDRTCRRAPASRSGVAATPRR